MSRPIIATAFIAMSLVNVSPKLPLIACEPPRAEYISIGIADRMISREDIEAKIEAERAEAERIAAEKAKQERISKMADGKIFTVLATAYTHTGNPTATGVMPQVGTTIAVDPRVIPLGSVVRINGHDYIAQDTGGLIKGKRIDIFMDTESECNAFGVQYLEVDVIG